MQFWHLRSWLMCLGRGTCHAWPACRGKNGNRPKHKPSTVSLGHSYLLWWLSAIVRNIKLIGNIQKPKTSRKGTTFQPRWTMTSHAWTTVTSGVENLVCSRPSSCPISVFIFKRTTSCQPERSKTWHTTCLSLSLKPNTVNPWEHKAAVAPSLWENWSLTQLGVCRYQGRGILIKTSTSRPPAHLLWMPVRWATRQFASLNPPTRIGWQGIGWSIPTVIGILQKHPRLDGLAVQQDGLLRGYGSTTSTTWGMYQTMTRRWPSPWCVAHLHGPPLWAPQHCPCVATQRSVGTQTQPAGVKTGSRSILHTVGNPPLLSLWVLPLPLPRCLNVYLRMTVAGPPQFAAVRKIGNRDRGLHIDMVSQRLGLCALRGGTCCKARWRCKPHFLPAFTPW